MMMHWQNLRLRTKLTLMMLVLLALSVSILTLLHARSERRLLEQVREYTEEVGTAIEIAQQQPSGSGRTEEQLLADYGQKLTKLGVREISIVTPQEEVKASTNPSNVGKKLVKSRKTERAARREREYIVRGIYGGDVGSVQTTSDLTVPIVAGDKRIGYLHLTYYLDSFSSYSRAAYISRLLATGVVFGLGILLLLVLTWSVTRPLRQVVTAVQRVAGGDLNVALEAKGRDEIGTLVAHVNEMIVRLRENRVLEERLQWAERTNAVGRLASAVAHEIRNPLNYINLSIDHVRSKFQPADAAGREEFSSLLLNIKDEISRVNRMVTEFLNFGKPAKLQPKTLSVAQIAQEALRLLRHKARDQGVEIVTEFAPQLPPIVADAEQLKTCFLNIALNAVEAMPSGGRLSVVASKIAVADSPAAVRIVFQDTGRGMSPDEAARVFEPYFSTKETGVGLGLALTRKIIEDHGGTIGVASAPGQGTTLTIELPPVARFAPAEAEKIA